MAHGNTATNRWLPTSVAGVLRYRQLVFHGAIHQLRISYAATLIGPLWSFVIPTFSILVYAVVLRNVMADRLASAGHGSSYALYVCSGALPWIFFADALTKTTRCLTENSHLLTRLPVPEEVYLVQTTLAVGFSFVGSLLPLVLICWIAGATPSWTCLLLPLASVVWLLTALGMGTVLGVVNVYFRDISQLIQAAMPVLFWSLPIAYVDNILPSALRGALPFHPLFPAMQLFRSMINGTPLRWTHILAATVWVVLSLSAGIIVLDLNRRSIRDEL